MSFPTPIGNPASVGVNRIDPFFGYTNIAVFLARATRRVAPTISPPCKGGLALEPVWGGVLLTKKGRASVGFPFDQRGYLPYVSFVIRIA